MISHTCSLLASLFLVLKLTFSKNYFKKFTTVKVSHSLDPDLPRYFVVPHLDANCLQRLLAIFLSHHQRGKSLFLVFKLTSPIYGYAKEGPMYGKFKP